MKLKTKVDGYDKWKPFRIAVSGCIDGFSRKNDVARMWKVQQWSWDLCSKLHEVCSWVWHFSNVPLHRLSHRKWTDGSTSLFLEIRACRWICMSHRPHVWQFNIQPTHWKLVAFFGRQRLLSHILNSSLNNSLLDPTFLYLLYVIIIFLCTFKCHMSTIVESFSGNTSNIIVKCVCSNEESILDGLFVDFNHQ